MILRGTTPACKQGALYGIINEPSSSHCLHLVTLAPCCYGSTIAHVQVLEQSCAASVADTGDFSVFSEETRPLAIP